MIQQSNPSSLKGASMTNLYPILEYLYKTEIFNKFSLRKFVVNGTLTKKEYRQIIGEKYLVR